MHDRVPALPFLATSPGLIGHAVRRFGNRDFIVEPDRRLTYAEADRLSREFARHLLAMGVTKGSRVAAKYPNGVEWAIAWLAVTRIGAFFLSVSSAYTGAETRKCLLIGDAEFYLSPLAIVGKDQRATVAEILGTAPDCGGSPLVLETLPFLRRVVFTCFGAPDQAGAIDLAAPGNPDDPRYSLALLDAVEAQVFPADWMLAIFTSGSTSDPKCVIHTHGGAIRHATAIADLNEWTERDRIFAGMPFFWVGGNCYTVLPAMLVGAAVICMERFEPGAALDLMEREGATRAVGWPGVINPLLEHPTLPGRAIRAFTDPQWDPRKWAMTGLGMSETASNHTALYIADRHLPAAAGATGRAIPFVEHRIVDEDSGQALPDGEVGSIQVRGYSVMAGYYKREREETFTPDGFFDTRDRGSLREGFLTFAGRDVGLIKTGGNNVSALEVEAALKAQPGIANALVVGIPDAALGQIVGAAIVPDGSAPDLVALSTELRKVMSSYKVPRVYRIMTAEEIPFLNNGKLDHRALVAKIAEAAGK